MNNPSIFSLLRQAITHAKFEDSETRGHTNELVDAIENELDKINFDFEGMRTAEAAEAMQKHLIELLQVEEEEEERKEVVRIQPTSTVSGGDLDDDEELNQ